MYFQGFLLTLDVVRSMDGLMIGSIAGMYFLVGVLVSMFLEHSYRDSLVPGSEAKYLTDSLRVQFILFWPYFSVKLILKIIEYYGSDDNTPNLGH